MEFFYYYYKLLLLLWWAGNVTGIVEKKSVYRILVSKPKRDH
jgi:hypothetical protein